MAGYSKNALRLARKLGETAANNLRRSGRTVTQDPKTGRYTVEPATELRLNFKEARELREESVDGFSDEIKDRIWDLLDQGHPGFRKLSAKLQRRGFELLADQIFGHEGPASSEEAASWRPDIYRELGLQPAK